MTEGEFTKESMSTDKLQYSLIPVKWLKSVVKVLTFGANKYSRDNWRKCKPEQMDLYWDALYRHLEAYREGEKNDPETNISHMAHATCNVIFIQTLMEEIDEQKQS